MTLRSNDACPPTGMLENHRGPIASVWIYLSTLVLGMVFATPALGQDNAQKAPASKAPADSKATQDDGLDDDGNPIEALKIYATAADYQGNDAFELAIIDWKKLIEKYPDAPIASKAQHYLGVCYLRQPTRDYALAINAFEQALKDKKLDVREESLVNLGWSLYMRGREGQGDTMRQDLEQAAKVFRLLREDYADGAYLDQALYYTGEANYMLGRGEEATKSYREFISSNALAKSPIRPDALYAMGVNFENMKQDARAKEVYDQFAKQYPEHRLLADVRLRMAELALNADEPQQALPLLKGLVEGKQTSTMQDYVLYRYAYALNKTGKPKEASAMFQRLVKEFPNSPYATLSRLNAGQSLMQDKQFDEAAAIFSKLIRDKTPQTAEAAHWLAQIHLVQKKWPEAAAVAREALQAFPSGDINVLLQMDLGDALLEQPESRSEARAIFEDVVNNHSDHSLVPRAMYNAAFTSLQIGALAEAKRWSETFLKRFAADPLAADVAFVNAESTLRLGQYPQAVAAFENLVKSQPRNPSLAAWQLRQATARYMSGEHDATLEQLKQLFPLLKQAPQQAEAHFLSGACLMQKANPKDALKAFEASLAASPNWSQADETWLLLARAQSQSGDRTKAKASLQELINKFPKSMFRDQAQLQLGQLAAAEGSLDESVIHYDKLINTSKAQGLVDLAKYNKARVLMRQDQFEPASKILEELSAGGREDGIGNESRMALGLCFRGKKQYGEAIDILKKMTQGNFQGDGLANIFLELGITYALNQDHAAAQTQFERILDTNPQYPNTDRVLYELAWSLKEQGKDKEAQTRFKQLVDQFPKSEYAGDAHFHVGQSLYNDQSFDQSAQSYLATLATSTDPELKEKALHKLGWSLFKAKQYDEAGQRFAQQVKDYPHGPLVLDAMFMQAECLFKQEKFAQAWPLYQSAKGVLDEQGRNTKTGEDIQSLIYLHGAQSARELKQWGPASQWLGILMQKYPKSPYLPQAKYELAFSLQNQQKIEDALNLYREVAENDRNETAARARFMMGEVYYAQKDYAKAITEYRRVMFGFGGTQATADIKNWQARSAFEAGRCAEQLIGNLQGDRRVKAVDIAKEFYSYVIQEHPQQGDLVKQAQVRVSNLK